MVSAGEEVPSATVNSYMGVGIGITMGWLRFWRFPISGQRGLKFAIIYHLSSVLCIVTLYSFVSFSPLCKLG